MDKFSIFSNGDVAAFDQLYTQYKADKNSVDSSWQNFFQGFEFQHENYEASGEINENMHKEFKVLNLINAYRNRGHLFTKTNPVRERRQYSPTLDIENFGLSEKDLEETYEAGKEVNLGPSKLKDIIQHLKDTYCQSIGIEFMYMENPEKVNWLKDKIELSNRPSINNDRKKQILHKLNQANVFEQFLQKKFVGQKRFSIEGAESLIPALDTLIEKGADKGVEEFVMGMAHRGRLNVLANIFNKSYKEIFTEFEGKAYENELFDGDVKYHLGYSQRTKTDTGKDIRMTLSPNPSHLEAVDPIVQGISRAKIDHYLHDENKIMPILIHGDAAVAGQGIVYEVIQMAQLDGYRTGGTIHIVINNQVGFTTNYLDARSSTYCTDIAKTTLCPVFHVNGDDVEALVQTMEIAVEFRQKFNKDVFIDLLCYRKYGHNEGDEPKFTQPKLYKAIAKHPNPREIYLSKLKADGIVTEAEAKQMEEEFHNILEEQFDNSKLVKSAKVDNFLEDTWEGLTKANEEDFDKSPDTSFDQKRLLELGKIMTDLPEGKKYFRKIEKLMNDRKTMMEENRLDWGMGEMLAYATLLDEKKTIRISGQDVERGTFSHRHAVVKTEDAEEEIVTLSNISDDQGKFSIYNSLLSEYGVLGFDYGYAFATPHGLTIWEAQFGDFNNGAQIILDQFLSAAEDKWDVMNGIVLLLPHGYEGMGSEHSSGRMERYLQLCAENNMQVANITTPANFFHALRRQLHRNFRKPLVVFTPKKLLRYPKAVSKIEELSSGSFQEVMDDTSVNPSNVDTVVFCTGKIYYDIIEQKEEKNTGDNIAIVRLEQLYPLPEKQMMEVLNKYNAKKILWVQEEPENMGAWSYMLYKFKKLGLNIDVISQPESGSPAAGSPKTHEIRHQAIFDKLFEGQLVS